MGRRVFSDRGDAEDLLRTGDGSSFDVSGNLGGCRLSGSVELLAVTAPTTPGRRFGRWLGRD